MSPEVKAEITLWEGLLERAFPPHPCNRTGAAYDFDTGALAMTALEEWDVRPGDAFRREQFRAAAKEYITELYDMGEE